MDIWKWVHDVGVDLQDRGEGRLAELLDELPSATCDDRHEEVDALVPEALALARSLELPWVELFVRHWSLQSRVLHRADGSALPEAIELLDFAHGEAARECPQAVCVVQDLAACYAQVDGPGYAEERMAVASETLSRIDPSWPCFECISEEHGSALSDVGRFEEAIAYLAAQERAARLVRRDAFAGRFGTRAFALIRLGRHEEALTLLAERTRGYVDRHKRDEAALLEALALTGAGRHDDARAALARVGDVLRTPELYLRWAKAAAALARASALANDLGLGRTLSRMLTRLDKQGIGRDLVELGELAAGLAMERGARALASHALSAMRRALPRLAAPLDAPERIARVEEALAAMPVWRADALPGETPEAMLSALQASPPDSPDLALAILEAAHARWPDHEEVASALASVASQLGLDEVARATLEAFCARFPDAPMAAVQLGEALLSMRDGPALHALAERLLAGPDPGAGHWLRAKWALSRRDHATAEREGLAVLAARPDSAGAHRLLLQTARERRDFSAMLRWSREIVEREPEAGPADWDRVVAGSAVGAWGDVRASAARLGFELEGEGPVDEAWALCRLRLDDDDRKPREVFALRTGPATARILEVTGPEADERYGDTVVFEPSPLPGGEDDAPEGSDRPPVRLFAALTTVRSGGFRSYVVDGVHPGAEAMTAVKSALQSSGLVLQVVSGEGYRLHPEAEAECAGVFAYLAVPAEVDAAAASSLLAEATRHLAVPLTWLGLAEEAEDAELVAKQQALVARYGL